MNEIQPDKQYQKSISIEHTRNNQVTWHSLDLEYL